MCTSQDLTSYNNLDLQDHCFICLEDTDDLHTHCKCNLKVHKKCFSKLIEKEVSK